MPPAKHPRATSRLRENGTDRNRRRCGVAPCFVSLVVALSVVAPARAQSGAAESRRPNVLLIAVDDLRPELGCYGAAHVVSPNIDRLARQGVSFDRAYCQQALCNPSRTSLMTGMRPESVGVLGNHTHFRDEHPDVATLPQHFKNNGYRAIGIGKLYHGPFEETRWQTGWDTMDDPASWSVPAVRFGPRYYHTEAGIAQAKEAYRRMYRVAEPAPEEWTRRLVFGPMTEAPEVADNVLYDGKVADAAIRMLGQIGDEPFFLAVGFIKPHTPFVAPKKYWDLYDADAVPLAENEFPAKDAPKIAGHNSGEVRRYSDQPATGPFTEANRRRLRHGYFACVSFVDAQIGRVLAELDRRQLRDKTVVVLYGDHGWHLGEQDLWGKQTNFEIAARAPLVISAPGAARDRRTAGLTELLDIYPTVCELAGLERPGHLEGESLAARLRDPSLPGKSTALTQYPRGKTMGYSLRTDRYRYTEWIRPSDNEARAVELYDHRSDPAETVNVAHRAAQAETVAALGKQLRAGFDVEPSKPRRGVVLATDFDRLPAGEIRTLETPAGTWTAEAGHAEIHDEHARSGRQSLRLVGGENRAVEFTPRLDGKAVDRLGFWAERWTRRDPFAFRVEALAAGKWREVYNGDKQIAVGPFPTRVEVDLGKPDGDDAAQTPPIEKLRFRTTAPAASGVLVDDLSLGQPVPMIVESATTAQRVTPVLVGNPTNPLARVEIVASGSLRPVEVTGLKINLAGTTSLADVEKIEVFYSGHVDAIGTRGHADGFADAVRFGEPAAPAAELTFAGTRALQPGVNYFWASCTLAPDADPTHRIDAGCGAIALADGTTVTPAVCCPPGSKRIGTALRKRGDDGVHTYRIPGLATTNRGTLIGVYDIRRRGGGDLPGDVDVGMSRSTDGGRTWEPMRVIIDCGSDPARQFDGVGDPCVLVDRKNGTIWVAALWSHGNRGWSGSGPGLTPDETGQLVLVRSDDDGRTWTEPASITPQVKDPKWRLLLQGPGRGIAMQDGTLVWPAQFRDAEGVPHSTIIASRDSGETWSIGTGVMPHTNEAQVAELSEGSLMINMRSTRGGGRAVATSDDFGRTWIEHPTSRGALPEPICMAGLLGFDWPAGDGARRWLAFSNPAVPKAPRRRMTIKLSDDLGRTWPDRLHLLLDEGGSAGYSCLTAIDRGTLGILYEGSQAHITFQRIELEPWMTSSE